MRTRYCSVSFQHLICRLLCVFFLCVRTRRDVSSTTDCAGCRFLWALRPAVSTAFFFSLRPYSTWRLIDNGLYRLSFSLGSSPRSLNCLRNVYITTEFSRFVFTTSLLLRCEFFYRLNYATPTSQLLRWILSSTSSKRSKTLRSVNRRVSVAVFALWKVSHPRSHFQIELFPGPVSDIPKTFRRCDPAPDPVVPFWSRPLRCDFNWPFSYGTSLTSMNS